MLQQAFWTQCICMHFVAIEMSRGCQPFRVLPRAIVQTYSDKPVIPVASCSDANKVTKAQVRKSMLKNIKLPGNIPNTSAWSWHAEFKK